MKTGNSTQEDPAEGDGSRYMELLEGKMQQTLSCGNVSTKLQRIAQLAREHPERSFTAISHVIDIELLKEAYHRTRKDGAAGVDGQTAKQYAAQLETNLGTLLNRFKDGTYRAPPVKRVYIPKGGGKGLRPPSDRYTDF
jgi:retron-type reverse transcriptase